MFERDLEAYLEAEVVGRDSLLADFSQLAYSFSRI